MKRKNLEKIIVLGLLLSSSVYGTAWADFTISEDGKTLYGTQNLADYKAMEHDGRELSSFDKIIINADNVYGLETYSGKFIMPNTNVIINVTGTGDNKDGVHLKNWGPNFTVNSYNAYIDAPKSDALNLSRDSTNTYAEINYLDVTVNHGNGIRANTAGSSNSPATDENVSAININKSAKITINSDSTNDVVRPTAVYAGTDYFWKSKGTATINLYGNTEITLKGSGNYGVWAGKNGSITVNDLKIISNKDDSYGVISDNNNIIYGIADGNKNLQESNIIILNGNNNKITMNGEDSKAIYADSQYGVVQSGANGIGNIDIVGDIEACNGGTIKLDVNGAEQNSLQGDIIAYGTQSNKNASVNLTTLANMKYQGDALAANGGVVDVTLGSGSVWSGRADDYQDAASPDWSASHAANLETKFSGNVTGNGTVNVDMGTGSTWNVTGQSWITNLKG